MIPGPPTIAEAVDNGTRRLRAAGVPEARRDARLLIAAALGAGPELLVSHPERLLGDHDCAIIEQLMTRRAAREPVSRILGWREFWGLDFKITPATLDPRPDSETLIEAVLGKIGDRKARLRILDLGTGSGCLLLALLNELPAAQGLGLDIDAAALEVARENAQNLGLSARAHFKKCHWAANQTGLWQVIVSNPPYIKDTEIEGLAPEVAQYDPKIALAAGPDGLDAYRALIPQVCRVLDRDGLLALEIGKGQQDAVKDLLDAAGLKPIDGMRDLAGVERCLLAIRRKPGGSGKK